MTGEAIDPEDWFGIRDAAFMLSREPREIHELCQTGQVNYTVRSSDGAWLIHIPSLIEYLTRTIKLVHRGRGDSPPVYAVIAASITRLEKKINTIIEGIERMSQADNQIEADVSALRSIFTAVQELVTTLNSTVEALKAQVAEGGAPSAQTLSDLDAVTQQFGGLVSDATNTPAPENPPTDSTVPPTDSGVDQGTGGTPVDLGGDAPADPTVVDVSNPISDTDAPGVDPVSGGAEVTDVPAADTGTDTGSQHTSP